MLSTMPSVVSNHDIRDARNWELTCLIYFSGHLGLFKAGILHRDVSVNNILLGRPGAVNGWRGVLIDLDMAIYYNDPERVPTKADYRTVSLSPLFDDHLVSNISSL